MQGPMALKSIQDAGAVNIISTCMQANPDLKELTEAGAAALKLLAGKDDVTRAMAVLLDFGKYGDVMITQALGLLGNLALIEENANFIVSQGGLDALLGLIAFKTKKTDLTPEEIAVVANGIRAMGRLLTDPKVTQAFVQKGGLEMLKEMFEEYDEEEQIMNACMDALGFMTKSPEGRKQVMGSGVVETATSVLKQHAEYGVMMQKYADVLANLPLDEQPKYFKAIKKAGLTEALAKNLMANYEDPETVKSIMDIMKIGVEADPKLAQGLAKATGPGIMKAIQAHQDDPEVLKHIFDAVHAMAVADPASLEMLKKIGLEDELAKILKQENISDETAAVIKDFYDKIKADDIDVDLTNVLLGLKGLGMPLDEITKNINEVEVKDEPEPDEPIDPNAVFNELKKLDGLLMNPNFAQTFVSEGKVGTILDNIQECYDDPKVVVQGLNALAKCALVPGSFPALEEAGVVEGVVQCMLEHPDDAQVQFGGIKVLQALAGQDDPLVSESLCQPITLETAVKGAKAGLADPNMMAAFADMVCKLMDDKQNAPQTAQQLAAAGAIDVLTKGMNTHIQAPGVSAKCQEALAKLNPHLFNPNILTGNHNAQVNPYGTISLAQIAAMPQEELDDMIKTYDTGTLMTTLRASRDPRMVQSSAKEINRRLQGGDNEVYNSTVSGGGIGDLLGQANNNMDNPNALGACLDSLGTLSTDDRLKTLLGMHGTIRLILETMRRHPNDIELLDKCCYILSNLTFNNQQNMTAVIELGGTGDIVGVINKHTQCNFICESAINVLVNLCHNSDKNKTLIARSGGAKATIKALKTHNKCKKDGDEAVVVSSFRCLANLAYVPDNVKQLIKLDTVAVVMDTMNQNTDKKDIIQMGVVVLANLSSHEKTAARMVHLGVLDLIIKVSESYPDELEIQRSCLGCVGNLMNEQSNAISFMDKSGHKRVFEIMEELVFEESVVILSLKLMKVLATNADVATELTLAGGAKVVAQTMEENKSNEDIIALGCQALCKLIVTVEAAKHISKQGVTELLVETAKDNNNWANIAVMNELVKVVVNICAVEENAQPFARNGSVCLLRAMEAHSTNAVFLNNAAMALAKLSIHPASSRPLVKRGAIAVILQSCKLNTNRKAILTRYIRTLTNFLYTEHKAGEELSRLNGYQIIKDIVAKHQDYHQMQAEFKAFEKAVKLKAERFVQKSKNDENKIRNSLPNQIVRLLTSGCIMKKYSENGKSKKRLVKCNDNLTLLLFEDPTGKKQPKQLSVKSMIKISPGQNSNYKKVGLQNANPQSCFALISKDPNGRDFAMGLECKDMQTSQKWMSALQALLQATKPGFNQ